MDYKRAFTSKNLGLFLLGKFFLIRHVKVEGSLILPSHGKIDSGAKTPK